MVTPFRMSSATKFIKFFLLIAILVPFPTALEQSQSTISVKSDHEQVGTPPNSPFPQVGPSSHRKNSPPKGAEGSPISLQNANSPTLTVDSASISEGYGSTYRATYSDDTHHKAKPNNYNLTVNPIDSTSYTGLDMNVTVYNDRASAVVEDGNGDPLADLSSNAVAQAEVLDLSSQNVFIDRFYLYLFGALQSLDLTGQIWNATLRASDSKVVPHKMLGLGSTVVSSTGFVSIPLATGVTIASSNTYTNGTGSYFFFVVNGSSGVSWFLYGDTTDGVDDGPTFISTSGMPSTEDGWGDYQNSDVMLQYNVSSIFLPSLIDLKVATPSAPSGINTQPSGRFIDNDTHLSSTVYRVFYNTSLVTGTPKLNITYLSERVVPGLAAVEVNTLPNDPNVNWTVTYDSPFSRSDSNVTQSITFPATHSVVSGTFNGSALTQGVDFTVTASGTNKTVSFNKGKGTYIFVLQSPNLLVSKTVQTYVENAGSWVANDTGVLGVVHPSAAVGDHVNATVLSSLNEIVGGTLNASLRGEDGSIYGDSSIGAYVDTSVNTVEGVFNGKMTFETYLDPNLPTGVWSFQFRWFNSTHAGAVAIPFNVIPVTDIQIVTPSSNTIDVLEGDIVTIEVITLDYSHNSSWGAPTYVNWEVENRSLALQGFYSDNLHYLYSTTLNTSIAHSNLIAPRSYTVNATFIQGPHIDFDVITMNVFYRGSATANGISSIEAGNTVSLDFIPTNVTGGGSIINSSSIVFDLDYPFTSTYVPSTGHHQIDVQWSNDFVIGANSIDVRWTHPDFREIASTPTITTSASFTVVDTSSPTFGAVPGSISISEGTTGNTLSWTVNDPFPDRYEIFRNGSSVGSGTWSDGVPITIGADGLARGVYNYTIFVNDTEGNFNTNEAIVTVTDDLAPNVEETVYSPTIAEDSSGNQILWNLTDVHPDQFAVYRNGTEIQSGTWDNPNYITVPVASSTIGVFNYTLFANDTSGNVLITNVFISVQDLTNPTITASPGPVVTYDEGATGNVLQWTATDKHASSVELLRNGTSVSVQAWTSGVANSFNVDGLVLGTYNFTVVFTDAYGNVASHQIVLMVEDGIPPVFISTPLNRTFFIGESGNSINWTVSDAHPQSYTIYQNGSVVSSGGWTSGTPIVIGLSSLSIGVYNYSILITDAGGNVITHSAYITIRSTSVPIFSSEPGDSTYSEGTSGNSLVWVANGQFPSTYTVYRNGSVFSSGAWQSDIPISVSIDGLTKGVYNFTIVVADEQDQKIISTAFVTVIDTTTPVGETIYTSVTLVEGIQNSLNWTISDTYPASYDILVDGTQVKSGTWISNVPLVVEFPYPAGNYNVTAVFVDESGNSLVIETSVTVIDITPPALVRQTPSNPITMDEQNLPQSIEWEFSDRHPSTYVAYLNSTVLASSSWSNNSLISIQISDLNPGTYNLTIVVMDLSGNAEVIQSTLIITDTTPPVFTLEPTPYRYFLGDTGNTLTWEMEDNFPSTYRLLRNGTEVATGSWNNSLTVNIDGLPLGAHQFELIVFDTSGNSASSEVIIRVKDPKITETSAVAIDITENVFEGAIETITGTWTTLDGNPIGNATILVSLRVINSTDASLLPNSIFRTDQFQTFENGSFVLQLNYTGTPDGTYLWIISFAKYLHENITQLYEATVLPHNLVIQIEALGELVRDKPYAISVSVFYNDTVPQTGLSLRSLTLKSGRASGVNVSIEISMVLLDGTRTTIQRFGLTGSTGVATVVISREETRLIDRIVSVSAFIPSSPYYRGTAGALPPESLPSVRSEAAGAFDRLFLQFSTDIRYPLALLGLVLIFLAIVGLIALIRKRRRAWFETLQKDSRFALDEIEALQSVKAVVLKNTKTGIPYYEQIFSDMATSIELISGLSSALTSFLDEVSQPGGFGVEILERSGLSLTSHRVEKSTLTIISDQPLPDSLISKASKAHISLHARISHLLDDPVGIQSVPPELVEDEFRSAGFNIHLKERLQINKSAISRIQNRSSLSRAIRKTIALLEEFPEEETTLEEIFRFLKRKQKNEEIAAKAIVFANAFKIIETAI